MMQRLYFAYGSNLSHAQMTHRCPDAEPFCRATLQGWSLEYRTYLNIKPDPDGQVVGALWYTSGRDEARLDRYEGFPTMYRKEEVRVQCEVGGRPRQCTAYVYVMNEGVRPIEAPTLHYLEVCLEGADDWSISDEQFLDPLDAAAHA